MAGGGESKAQSRTCNLPHLHANSRLHSPHSHANSRAEEFGSIESVKAASELYSPCHGTIKAVNEDLADSPNLVNESAEQDGWLIKLELSSPDQLQALMSKEQYDEFLKSASD